MLNIEKIGTPIAKITGGKLDKKIIYLAKDQDDIDTIEEPFDEINLKTLGGKFSCLPNPDIEREIIYVFGCSGSGKSTYISNYIDEWIKKHRDWRIILFSEVREDSKLDKFHPIRVKLDDALAGDNFTGEDFKDSLVIFDDIEGLDKPLQKEVVRIMNTILTTGRHYNTTALITAHNPSDRNRTKVILQECHSIVYFPHGSPPRTIDYVMKDYAGMDQSHVRYCSKKMYRWVHYYKHYPPYILTDTEIFFNTKERNKDGSKKIEK